MKTQPHVARINRGAHGDLYETPWEVIWLLRDVLGDFTLDVCASPENAKAPKFYTEEDDGLAQPWHGKVWCNPPFSMKKEFLRCAVESRQDCESIAVLLPNNARETDWWRQFVWEQADEIITLAPRVQFTINGKRPVRLHNNKTTQSGVAYGSCIAVYRPRFHTVRYGCPREYILDIIEEAIWRGSCRENCA